MSHVLAFGMPSLPELALLAAIGLLFFGKRLPEVGRSLGQGIVQFKKGLRGIEEEVEQAVNTPVSPPVRVSSPALIQSTSTAGHKFDPITGAPLADASTVPAGAKFDPFTGK